ALAAAEPPGISVPLTCALGFGSGLLVLALTLRGRPFLPLDALRCERSLFLRGASADREIGDHPAYLIEACADFGAELVDVFPRRPRGSGGVAGDRDRAGRLLRGDLRHDGGLRRF